MKGRNPKERLFLSGAVLLALLIAGIFVAGRIINRTAAGMSERIVTQVGEYHYRLLDIEFGKAEEIFTIAEHFLRQHPHCSDAELYVLATTLLQSDPKMSRIWFSQDNGRSTCDFSRNGLVRRASIHTAGDFRQQIAATITTDSLWNQIVCTDQQFSWSLARSMTCCDGSRYLYGIDLPLLNMHSYMAEQNPFSRSYAAVFTPNGTIVYHPDSLQIGTRLTDPADLKTLGEVVALGHKIVTYPLSDYLGVEEERIYYPMPIDNQVWVAMIGIPRFAIEQEIEEFHHYTLLIAVISIILFGTLLILAQRRWRREYDLRRISERESAQLHLQRVLDQIDPHFLFNSLNSLYSLIRTSPDQAREFTLTLSRLYRHVLERRREILTTVADEVEFTRQYYALQKIRLDDCITLTININRAYNNRRIPSMSLQTLVENAVKHNQITGANPLHIRIYTTDDHLVIENNYTPREESSTGSWGVGLESIRSVYRFYISHNIETQIVDGLFRCRLPLLPAAK